MLLLIWLIAFLIAGSPALVGAWLVLLILAAAITL